MNPLNLTIGDVVKVARTCTVEYDEDNQKKLFFHDFDPPALVVTGVVKKALGKYVSGSGYRGASFLGYDDYEPPSLQVSKYIWLYECRAKINGHTLLVHPDDITK